MRIFLFISAAILIAAGSLSAQPMPDIPPPKMPDTLRPIDTTNVSDSTATPADTLSDAERAMKTFEERYKDHKKAEEKEKLPRLLVLDSLTHYFLSVRQDQADWLERAFFQDAGDYFRASPSFFELEHLATPMRHTVSPYGLRGDRLAVMVGNRRNHPFEHIIEPDGMINLEDIPTALNDRIYIVNGMAGRIFGAGHGVASLVTLPAENESTETETAILHDRGSFSYNNTRGRLTKNFNDGRVAQLGVEYRNGEGLSFDRYDDSYSYHGRFYFPFKSDYGFNVTGQLYNRSGRFIVRRAFYASSIGRDKFDRSITITGEKHNVAHTQRTEIGYNHERQKSNLNTGYTAFFNYTGNYGLINHERMLGSTLIRIGGRFGNMEYRNADDEFNRLEGEAYATIGLTHRAVRLALTAGSAYAEDFDVLPYVTALAFYDRPSFFITASVGYSERAPSMHELYQQYERVKIYSGEDDYADSGNPNLNSEKAIVGSVSAQLGGETRLEVDLTGGMITDGIEYERTVIDSLAIDYALFQPRNRDVNFVTISGGPQIKLSDLFYLKGGGAWYKTDYDGIEKQPYSPEYRVFGGGELHVYWQQRLLHLYAYGELCFVGPYSGYDDPNLGEEVVFNAKLSFRIKRYRMHFVFQNELSNAYQNREYIDLPAQYFYFGFSWAFSD